MQAEKLGATNKTGQTVVRRTTYGRLAASTMAVGSCRPAGDQLVLGFSRLLSAIGTAMAAATPMAKTQGFVNQ